MKAVSCAKKAIEDDPQNLSKINNPNPVLFYLPHLELAVGLKGGLGDCDHKLADINIIIVATDFAPALRTTLFIFMYP